MPESKPRGNRGGGRPRLTDPSESKARKIHQVRAHDDEWPIIKAFIDCTRLNSDLCKMAVMKLKVDIENAQRQLEKETEKYKKPSKEERDAKVRELREEGRTQTEIAQLLGLTQAQVSRILNA